MDNCFLTKQSHKGGASMQFYWIIAQMRKFRKDFLGCVLPCLERGAVEGTFDGFTTRNRIYHTWALFQTFLSQVAMGGGCREAIEVGVNQGWLPVHTSPKTSAYCNARSRFPEAPLKGLAFSLGHSLERAAADEWLFCGRQVKVIDGTSVQLPDTGPNQSEYPQPNQQKPGCGFPVMYISVLMGLGSGAIIDAETSGGSGYERSNFRTLWRSLEAGDIVLGDAGYGSYAEVAMLGERGVDAVFRQSQRKPDTLNGIRLGRNDWLVIWNRPATAGGWVDVFELPERMVIRAIRFQHKVKGFRSKDVTIYTTLLDPKRYPKAELIKLYRRRWEMELRFRDIKTTMGLEMLKCKTPDGCRKELWMGLLAYNLVRSVMANAALERNVRLSRISFAGAAQRLTAFASGYLVREDTTAAYNLLIKHLVDDLLPHRPNRVEPRKRKRRPKNYRLLTVPRNIEHSCLLQP
jgi:hypothetical protein